MEDAKAESLSRKERKNLLVSQLKDLTSQIVTDDEMLRMFAERWRSGFWSYSLSNLFLIWFQRPSFSLVAGYNQWRKVGRYVMKGEKAIWILAPCIYTKRTLKEIVSDDDEEIEEEKKVLKGFIPVCVFDYSQTDGDELQIGNTEVTGTDGLTVDALSQAFDIPVVYTQGLADGRTDGKKIWISTRENKSQEAAAYIHEVSHIVLGHFTDRRKDLTRQERELEAESVSYIVGACIGIDNQGAKKYLGHWNANGDQIKEHSLKIVAAADKILRKLNPLLSRAEITAKGEGRQSSLPS
jgi:antirestriction protein ArdC